MCLKLCPLSMFWSICCTKLLFISATEALNSCNFSCGGHSNRKAVWTFNTLMCDLSKLCYTFKVVQRLIMELDAVQQPKAWKLNSSVFFFFFFWPWKSNALITFPRLLINCPEHIWLLIAHFLCCSVHIFYDFISSYRIHCCIILT